MQNASKIILLPKQYVQQYDLYDLNVEYYRTKSCYSNTNEYNSTANANAQTRVYRLIIPIVCHSRINIKFDMTEKMKIGFLKKGV